MDTATEKLQYIQQRLNAPKDKTNKFGGYTYRSCESILEAVKPLLAEIDAVLYLSDEVVEVGSRIYVKATATFRCSGSEPYKVTAYAREGEKLGNMSESQLTGAASSYARKYALCGLFAIDDNKDADDLQGMPVKTEKRPIRVHGEINEGPQPLFD